MTARVKRIRALKKKLRECEALLKKREGGTALIAQEEAKLEKMDSWYKTMWGLQEAMFCNLGCQGSAYCYACCLTRNMLELAILEL